MNLPGHWRRLFTGKRSRSRPAQLEQRFQLMVEILEARLAPAAITVTSLGDTNAVDGGVTLREAILSIDQGSNVNADINGLVEQHI